MSQIQIERCRVRINDPVIRDRFERMLKQADALTYQAAQLRREAWAEYRAAIVVGQYA